MHFNTTTLKNAELVKDLSDGEQDSIKIRYGVIELDDLLRDLKLWETLLTSSFMQRPHEVLEKGQNYDKIIEMQRKNLTSALAYAAMTTPNGADEHKLYQTIVEIPHYQQKKVSYLLDKEDEEMVVDDSFEGFQSMYQPLAQDHFKDVFEIRDGKFFIDSENKATQKLLYMAINDNIYKNLDGFSVRLFDQDQRFNKE